MTDISKRLADLSPEKLELLRKKLKTKDTSDNLSAAIVAQKNGDSSVLSFAQQRLWFLDQLESGNPFYNIASAIRLKGKLDIKILEQSINAVIEKHDILRASYQVKNGESKQLISKEFQIQLNVKMFNSVNEKEILTKIKQIAEQESSISFDLKVPPLIRFQLLKFKEDDFSFIFCLHHIIADGWSIPIFINEIALFYQDFKSKKSSHSKKLEIQYADFAAWQNKFLNHSSITKQLEFWKEKLRDMPPVLNLKTDYLRPVTQTYKGKHLHFNFGESLSTKIKTFSKEIEATLFLTLLSVFQILLYRYSNQDDFGIGVPIANRNRKEIESLIGFFVNTLVIRSQVDADMSFTDLLGYNKKQVIAAYDNQDVPFEQVVDALLPVRDLSISPLFQVMFLVQEDPVTHFKFPGLDIQNIEFETGIAKFDLALIIEESQQLKGIIEYNCDLFDDKTIEILRDSFINLADNICRQPNVPISRLKMMATGTDTFSEHLNNTLKPELKNNTVIQLFEEKLPLFSQKTALRYYETSLTYEQWNRQSNRLAHYLRSIGVKPEVLVGISFERSIESMIAILAILKAGGAYVPIDTNYPENRINYIIDDAGIQILLTQNSLKNLFPKKLKHIIYLDNFGKDLTEFEDSNPENICTPENLAYMIYTSGSTGIPKGTAIQHQSLCNFTHSFSDIMLRHEKHTMLHFASLSFDASVAEIFPALHSGSELVIANKEDLLPGPRFYDLLNKYGISLLIAPPSVLALIQNETLPGLKTIVSGGEALNVDLANKLYDKYFLINVYGPTENTVVTTTFDIENKVTIPTVSIGKPLYNVNTYILDNSLNSLPVGVTGELLIGGNLLARGYHNRPSLTAEKFIPDPFSAIPGARLYRSGDLARFLHDGSIAFEGRIDDQVKIRGFRIELGEIKNSLLQNEKIIDATVIVREDNNGNKQLIAYYISSDDSDVFDLKEQIRKTLPDYMVPNSLIRRQSFPLTVNNKIDIRALENINDSSSKEAVKYVEPRDELEKYFAEHWKNVLNLEKISVYDNFFELGGNSLKAAVLINRLQEEINQQLHVGMIFKAPVIAELAMYAREYFDEHLIGMVGEAALKNKLQTNQSTTAASKKISNDDIDKLRKIIIPLPKREPQTKASTKNKPAVFVLSPPRSGSTLLRVMLAGNSALFSPPELDLLGFNTIQERNQFFRTHDLEIWLEATQRAIMELKNISSDEAAKLIKEYEHQNISSKQFYVEMQKLLGDRLLVDKTPSYPLDRKILERAEEDFENPMYIHLIRHPYAMIYSFVEAKLDENFFKYKHPFTRQQLAELVWIICHENIIDFLDTVPAERKLTIHFENLVSYPSDEIQQICTFLNIPFHEEMLMPYEGKKMTDGIKETSQMVGDFKFYLHKNINKKVAERWRGFHRTDFLSDYAWNIAERFGYPVEKELASKEQKDNYDSIPSINRKSELPLSYAQERLWFIDQLEPGNPQYNVPGGIILTGEIEPKNLEKALNLVVLRHENLRTVYKTINGKSKQEIQPALKISLKIIDFRNISSNKQDSRLKQFANSEAAKPFNLSKGPLIRAHLIKLSESKHILTIVMHHIISDGWSINILFKEWVQVYQALKEERIIKLPVLDIQYADYAAWQKKWLSQEKLEKQKIYWQEKLSGAAPVLDLPTDAPRKNVQSVNGNTIIFRWPSSLTKTVHQIATRFGVTSFMTLLASFKILLYRYSNQSDISIGTPVANRTRREIEPLIGFFVNTLVLRDILSPEDTFEDILKSIQETTTQAYENQDIPFEKLVDLIEPDRSLTHSPLFQVMFALQSSEFDEINIPGVEIAPYSLDSGTSKFDLTVTMVERFGELRGQVEYNTDLFLIETIERLIKHFEIILHALCESPLRRISELKIIDNEEEHKLIAEFNSDFIASETTLNIAQKFEEQAKSTPKATALKYSNQKMTYNELNGLSNKIARLLLEKGVQSETLVGVSLNRSMEMVAILLGILKSGAAYMPLDPTYPQDRLHFMIKDSGCQIVICEQSNSHHFNSSSDTTICIDQKPYSDYSVTNLNLTISNESLAYVIYTSGSTGVPKGVANTHKNVCTLLDWSKKAFLNNSFQEFLFSTSISFDVSVFEIFATLCNGGSATIVENIFSLNDFNGNNKVQTISTVPSALAQLLHIKAIPKSVKRIMTAGELLSVDLVNKLYELNFIEEVHDLYGPTEQTVYATHTMRTQNGISSIGKPLSNTQAYILDDAFNVLPVGIPGELHLSGDGQARGYLNRPGLTAEKFVPDPFSGMEGSRLYKTGDLARWLPNGEIQFMGRLDQQVKIRGFRIELGEVENTLLKHDNISDAVARVHKTENSDHQLVAYFVSASKQKPSVHELRDFITKSLPDYMVPAYFVQIDELPLTPNGKLDHKRLPKPELTRKDLQTKFKAPQNKREKILLKIWQNILKNTQIGIEDNFFELGGDSILSIQVISAAAQEGLKLTPKQIFENPTIEKLALVAGESVAINAEQGVLSGHIENTPIQHWFFKNDFTNQNYWNQSILISLKKGFDTAIMTMVIEKLLIHHDALRIHFKIKDKTGLQVYSAPVSGIPFEVKDISGLQKTNLDTFIKHHAERIQASLNIEKGPVIRFVYFGGGSKHDDLLLIVVHHLVIDGISWRILIGDFQNAYELAAQNKEISFPPKTTSYKFWAWKLKTFADQGGFSDQIEFWQKLQAVKPQNLPELNSLHVNLEKDSESLQKVLDAENTAALLDEVIPIHQVEINEILLSALLLAFSKLNGYNSIFLDIEGHGREDIFEDVDISRTIGWFTTIFPVFLKCNSLNKPVQILKQVKQQLRLIPSKGIGFGILKYLAEDSIQKKMNRLPTPAILYNYLGQFEQQDNYKQVFNLNGAERAPENKRTHLLDISISIINGILHSNFTFSREKYDSALITKLSEEFILQLKKLIISCREDEADIYTSSDFIEADLEQSELDDLLSELDEA